MASASYLSRCSFGERPGNMLPGSITRTRSSACSFAEYCLILSAKASIVARSGRRDACHVQQRLADHGRSDETVGLRRSQPPGGTMRPSPNPVPAGGWDCETRSSRCALGLGVSPSPEKDHVLLGLIAMSVP